MAAGRPPAGFVPTAILFFLPVAMGRMAFSRDCDDNMRGALADAIAGAADVGDVTALLT